MGTVFKDEVYNTLCWRLPWFRLTQVDTIICIEDPSVCKGHFFRLPKS